MKNIAIIEDEEFATEDLRLVLTRFGKENGEEFRIVCFKDAVGFLTNYKANYDVVFMDIEMPYMDGMTAAVRLRELDASVMLVFVTNMAKYAVKGYEVNAFCYIVKPFGYYDFSIKMKKIIESLNSRTELKLKILSDGAVICLESMAIIYVEIRDHDLVYHTVKGNYTTYGSLKSVEELLYPVNFRRCNNCYLVNLRYVTEVCGYELHIGGDTLQISQPKRKDFMKALSEYLGKTL